MYALSLTRSLSISVSLALAFSTSPQNNHHTTLQATKNHLKPPPPPPLSPIHQIYHQITIHQQAKFMNSPWSQTTRITDHRSQITDHSDLSLSHHCSWIQLSNHLLKYDYLTTAQLTKLTSAKSRHKRTTNPISKSNHSLT